MRQDGSGSAEAVCVVLEHVECAECARRNGLAPSCTIVNGDRLRSETVDVVTCKRAMQLGGAAADLPHALQHRRHFGRFGGDLVGQQALLVDQAIERSAADAPGIALVLDKGVHRCERGAGVTLDQLNGAEQGRRILEMRDIGQETPDLELRMNARRYFAQNLDDVLVVDDYATVRLLAVDRRDGLDFWRRAAERRRRTEFDLLCVTADRFPASDLRQQNRDEIQFGCRVDQGAFAGSATHSS